MTCRARHERYNHNYALHMHQYQYVTIEMTMFSRESVELTFGGDYNFQHFDNLAKSGPCIQSTSISQSS